MSKNRPQQEFESFRKYLDVVATTRKDRETAIKIADQEMLYWYKRFDQIETDLREDIHETVREICGVDYIGMIDIPDFTKTDNTRDLSPYLDRLIRMVGKVPEGISVENRKMLCGKALSDLSANTQKMASVLERLRIHSSSWTSGTQSPESIHIYNDTKLVQTYILSMIGPGIYRYKLRAMDLSDD